MVTESDNIVAETAARIFADLADPQTINRARDDRWKDRRCGARLVRSRPDAGLGAGKTGRRGRQPRRRLRHPRRRRPLCRAGAAGGNADRRMAAGARRHCSPCRRDDGCPGAPARPHCVERRRQFERTRERNSLRQGLRTHRGRGYRRQGRGDCLGQNRRLPRERRPKSRRRCQHRDLRAHQSDPQRARRPVSIHPR